MRKSLKPCNEPGCPQQSALAIASNTRHLSLYMICSVNHLHAVRGYNNRWRKAREGYLAKHPLCQSCMLQGKRIAATVVDNIKPHKGDKKLFWDSTNWQPLCASCHSRKTAKEDGWFGNGL